MGNYREQFEELVNKLLKGKSKDDFLLLLDSFDTRDKLFHALLDDFKTSNELLKENNQSQYYRRTLVRTAFAMIEGLLNVLTQTVLETSKNGFFELSKHELEKITEQTISKNGQLRAKFISLTEKMQFSFSIFSQKMGGFEFVVDTTTNNWEKFETAISVRNQLMHPRTPKDLLLDDKQLSIVLDTTIWFIDLYKDLEKQVGEMSSKRSLDNLIKARIKGIQSGK